MNLLAERDGLEDIKSLMRLRLKKLNGGEKN
jgi:hypothetical protein